MGGLRFTQAPLRGAAELHVGRHPMLTTNVRPLLEELLLFALREHAREIRAFAAAIPIAFVAGAPRAAFGASLSAGTVLALHRECLDEAGHRRASSTLQLCAFIRRKGFPCKQTPEQLVASRIARHTRPLARSLWSAAPAG